MIALLTVLTLKHYTLYRLPVSITEDWTLAVQTLGLQLGSLSRLLLREAIREKNQFLFGFFQKGGGSCPKPNFSRNFYVWTFFRKRGGGLPISKVFEELFCLNLV